MRKLLFSIIAIFFTLFSFAQAGAVDLSFNIGSGADSTVYAIATQTDGKILIAGGFHTYNGTSRLRIARLNIDGSLDPSFNPGSGAYGNYYHPDIHCIAIQSDGKILIGGSFRFYNGTARNCIARLNLDGSLDATFNPGSGATNNNDPAIYSIKVLGNGQVLIVGDFNSYNGISRKCIARLNSDGSLDASFNPGSGVTININSNTPVQALVTQTNGKILIGGRFSAYNGVTRQSIARLNSDGSLDSSFTSALYAGLFGQYTALYVSSICIQNDGKILVAGRFSDSNFVAGKCFARLNSDGSLDTSFNTGSGPNNDSYIHAMALQSDGKILIGGGFITSYNGTNQPSIIRINSDGSLDASFSPGPNPNYPAIFAICIQSDSKILVGGAFNSFNGLSRNSIVRLGSVATAVSSININHTIALSPNPVSREVNITLAGYTEGALLIFTNMNGVELSRQRITSSSSLDMSCYPAGLYFVEVVNKRTGLRENRKIVKL